MASQVDPEKLRFDWVRVSEGAAALIVVIGALVAVWQYWEAKSDQRVSRTLEYIRRYESGDVGVARRRVNSTMFNYLDQFADLDSSSLGKQDRDRMVRAIVAEESGMARDLDVVFDSFDGLHICIEERLCDRDVALNYFRNNDARDLLSTFAPYIVYRRENNSRYARAIEIVLGSP